MRKSAWAEVSARCVARRMAQRLKADFHCHTSDDPHDEIFYSSEMLIDALAALEFSVLAIACHDALVYTEALAAYARRRGILLIPAIESTIEGKHILLLNPDAEQARARTFEELRRLGRRDAAIVAPHPYYPIPTALGAALESHIDLFDAIEYCSLYQRGINPNRRARRVARRHGLPMLGSSDCHALPYSDSTFTWVASEPAVPAVINAIRDGRVEVATRPRPWRYVAQMLSYTIAQTRRNRRRRRAA